MSGLKRKTSYGVVCAAVLLLCSLGVTGQEQLAPTANNIPAGLFGLHIHHLASTTPWPGIPFGNVRLWDAYTDWPHLEPQPGKFDFKTLDAYVDAADSHHVEILLTLGLTPAWASSRPNEKSGYAQGNAAPPKNLDDWRTYVRTVATRYRGHIRYYEIWNEPNLPDFYTGTPEQLVTLTKEAESILRAVDPGNRIVSPSATGSGGVSWLREFLESGGGRYIDVVGYHLYVTPNPPEEMTALVAHVFGVMSECGIRDHELWDTESGWRIANHKTIVQPSAASGFGSKVLTDDEASAYVARTYVLLWASQVSRFYWYAWDDGVMGLTEADGRTLKAPALAYIQVEKWLVGARMTSCGSDNSGTWVCQIVRDGGYSGRIVWNPNKTFELQLPKAWGAHVARDLSGTSRNIAAANSVKISPLPLLLDNRPE